VELLNAKGVGNAIPSIVMESRVVMPKIRLTIDYDAMHLKDHGMTVESIVTSIQEFLYNTEFEFNVVVQDDKVYMVNWQKDEDMVEKYARTYTQGIFETKEEAEAYIKEWLDNWVPQNRPHEDSVWVEEWTLGEGDD
jgi:predicted RNase H-like HicB family nuclease